MFEQRLNQGWQGYLMTFMFRQMAGSQNRINHQMRGRIEGVYASLLTRCLRKPNSFGVGLPILVASPDWPVSKRDRNKAMTWDQITTNGGLHYHGVLVVPPPSTKLRLKVPIDQHFADHQGQYLQYSPIERIEIHPIVPDEIHRVTDYALKGLKQNRLPDEECLLVLPKSGGETKPRPFIPPSPEFQRNELTSGANVYAPF
jgi:hypothetical protein